jgi:MFS family permease
VRRYRSSACRSPPLPWRHRRWPHGPGGSPTDTAAGGRLLLAWCSRESIYCVYGLRLPPGWIVALALVEGAGLAAARAATDGFLADHVPQGLQGRIHARFSAAGTAGSLVGATVSGFLYTVEPGAPLLAMGVLYLLVAMALLVESAIGHIFGAVSAGHGRAGHSVGCVMEECQARPDVPSLSHID